MRLLRRAGAACIGPDDTSLRAPRRDSVHPETGKLTIYGWTRDRGGTGDSLMKHVLFLCSQNRLRSPTAETIFSDCAGFEVRSAGLDHSAIVPATPQLVQWADYIFVMEKAHRRKLQKRFRNNINKQRIICLDIPDEFEYMDEALIGLLRHRLGVFFGDTGSQ